MALEFTIENLLFYNLKKILFTCISGAHPAPAETDPRAYKGSLECLVKPVLSLWEAYNTPAAFWQASLKPFCATYPPIHLHAE